MLGLCQRSFFLSITLLTRGWLVILVLGPVGMGCSRVKDKLERLASAGRVEVVSEPEVELTAEEKRLNALLEDPEMFDASAPTEVPKAEAFELNQACIVSILGYHDFRDRGGDAMVINKDKFRQQMQSIKDSNIPVIPLGEVMEWKKGQQNIPNECFVITMDDGWEGVYDYAFPVLKEFQFPFTIYLYKKYVNIGGRSMSWDQIKEMMATGLCTVGSHSVSHDSMTSKKGRSDEAYELYLLNELKDSKSFIEENLGIDCLSFAYPYGNYNDTIRDLAHQVGYEAMVTVNGSKVNWETPLGELSRFIVHGVNDSVFELASSFRGRGSVDSTRFVMADAKDEVTGEPLVVLNPAFDEVIPTRLPLIEAALGKLGEIVPDSVSMHVGGLGPVPAEYDPVSQVVRYQVPYRLRREECDVTVTFRRVEAAEPESLVWRFRIDLAASYLPQADDVPMQPATLR